jgi:CBS-domain-containing membrane protein
LDLVKREFLGFVDVLDILSFIVSFFKLGEVIDSATLFARSQELFAHSITDVIGMSHRLTAVDIHKTTPLWDAIAIFQKGAHRLPITNEDGVIINLISQTDVLRFLMTQRDYYDSLFESTLEDLKLGRHHAVSIHQDQTTLAALQKMQQGNMSALAIVNSQNELVGNLSASDLKGAVIINDDPGSEPLGCLLLPILAFLHQSGKRHIEPYSCTHQTTLGSIIEQMLNLGYHRVWVVDQARHVKSVITMTDVMRAVIQQKPKFFNEEQKANKIAQQKVFGI